MHTVFLAAIGAVAGVINLVGLLPYIRDIFRHKTKPERAMWWIYAFLFAMLFAAQVKAGAGWLLLVTGIYVLSSAVIAGLSLKYGYGSFHRRDTISVVVAALGLALWLFTSDPLLAVITVVIVDFAGFWLTLTKTWHAPHSETLISWQASCAAAILSVFSANAWKLDVLIYPIYAAIATALIVWLIMYRRTKVTEDLPDF